MAVTALAVSRKRMSQAQPKSGLRRGSNTKDPSSSFTLRREVGRSVSTRSRKASAKARTTATPIAPGTSTCCVVVVNSCTMKVPSTSEPFCATPMAAATRPRLRGRAESAMTAMSAAMAALNAPCTSIQAPTSASTVVTCVRRMSAP